MVSMFTKAIALAFFTSVVDASNIMSNDLINPAKFREMVQSLSSKWSEQYARSYTRRHLQNDAACMWIPQTSQCIVSESFTVEAATADPNNPISKGVSVAIACSKKIGETDCAADAKCAYSAGVCEMSKSEEKELHRGMKQVLTDKCGTLADMYMDDCSLEDTEASCESEQNCNWETEETGTLEPDEAGTNCVIIPPEGYCQKSGEGADSTDAMMKSLCPGVEECETKPVQERMSCSAEKCPIMGAMLQGFACAAATTQDACTSLPGDTCIWKNGDTCSFNVAPLLDQVIPEGCPLRPVLEQQIGGSSDSLNDAVACGSTYSEDACGAAGAQCQWVTYTTCMSEGAAPTNFSHCGYNHGVQDGESMAHLLGPVGAQMTKCSESETQTACEATPKGSVEPVDGVAPATDGTGTASIPMGGALTIGVIVSLMIYS